MTYSNIKLDKGKANVIFQEDQLEMDFFMELNVSLQNEREICSDYCVLHIKQMEVVLLRVP